MKEQWYLQVGKYKGSWDFGVSGLVSNLTYEEMKELREMVVVGIGVMEDMWRRTQEDKEDNKLSEPKAGV